jgi:hypothetical protein
MYFTKTLFMSPSLIVAAVAQTTSLFFTTLPTSVTAGSPIELKWAGGDGTVSTILLQLNRNEQSVNRLLSTGGDHHSSATHGKQLANCSTRHR